MILVDTDVLVAHLRGLEAARGWLASVRAESELAVSVVTMTEILGGMRSQERLETAQLLATFHAEPVSEAVARRAGEFLRTYRASHQGVGVADYLIAATADVGGHRLATMNVRHFPMFDGLQPPFVRGRS